MIKEKILKGIEDYGYEQAVLLRLIRKSSNGLSDDKFDSLFNDYKEKIDNKGYVVKTRRCPKIRFMGYQPETFLLGNMMGDDWSKWIHLLGLMCKAQLVREYQENGHVVYRIL
ncbi:MAG: hypothetical protein ACUZ8I_07675 [Candidatus Scalindua sp.]